MLDRAKVREVYLEAAEYPEAERPAFLDHRCAGDPELRAEVASLLASAAIRPSFMESPTTAPGEALGTRIGPYRLLQEIGHGGFGSVYMAEQDKPVHRRLALKIIKLGMDTRAVIARFEAERQALAMMDHANIARVYDAGATESGRPYFVMELVRGEPITAYCDKSNLSIPDRLHLFLQVCHAVQHAHGKGVIHRDLKPGNILVSTEDGKPHAKVIDFGIAKATDHRLTEKTVFTDFRQFIGTPEYMSPEQAAGSFNIDTRSDVYSLGVLLYELLTGGTPFDPKALRSAAYAEVQRIIREVEPERPSTRLSKSAFLDLVATQRHTEPQRLSALVKGDLDWIVMKALDKERARRYDTASALAADIARHLAGDPVEAAPPSLGYKTRKFVRRHRGVVVACVAVMSVVLLGTAGTTWGMLSAWEAQRVAQSQRDLASTVRTFLAQTFEGVSPQVARGRNTELLGALMDQAAARIKAGELTDNPSAERELRYVIASVYNDIARYDDARAVLRPLGADPGALATHDIRLLVLRADLAIAASDIDGAEDLLLGARRRLDASATPDPRSSSGVFAGLGRIALERQFLAQAEDHEKQAVQSARAVEPFDPELISERLRKLGVTANKQGRENDALAHWGEALRLVDPLQHQDSPVRVDILNDRAAVYAQRLEPDLARADLEEALRTGRRMFAESHPSLLKSRYALSNIYLHTGKYSEALAEFEAILALTRTLHGEQGLEAAPVLDSIAQIHFMSGRYQQALDAALECEAVRDKHLSPQSLAAGSGWTIVVDSLRMLGRNDEALRLARKGVEAQQKFLPPASEEVLIGLQTLMACLLFEGRFEECAQVGRQLLEACAQLRDGSMPIWVHDAQIMTAGALLTMNDPHDAPEAERLLRACLHERERRFGDKNIRVATARVTLGRVIAAQLKHTLSVDGPPHEPGTRAAILDRFREAESLLVNNFQSQIDALTSIPAAIRRMRIEGPAESLVNLYDTWDTAEPGTGKAQSASDWRMRLAEVRALVVESMKPVPK